MSDHLDNGGHLVCSVDWQQAPAEAEQDAGAAAASSCLGCATRHQLHERLSDLSRTAAPTSYLPRLTRATPPAFRGKGGDSRTPPSLECLAQSSASNQARTFAIAQSSRNTIFGSAT